MHFCGLSGGWHERVELQSCRCVDRSTHKDTFCQTLQPSYVSALLHLETNTHRQDSWVVVPLHSILKHQQKDNPTASTSSSTANGNSKGTNSNSSSRSSSPAKAGGKSSSSNGGKAGGRGRGVQPVVVPDGCLEGTRLTLVNVPNQPDAVEFSIR